MTRPVTFKGAAGTTTWTKILFSAPTTAARWSASADAAGGCAFKWTLTVAGRKPVATSAKAKSGATVSGTKNVTTDYADGALTAVTDCPEWSVKLTSGKRPGVAATNRTRATKVTASTADELNEAMEDAYVSWRLSYGGTYFKGTPCRPRTLRAELTMTERLPSWTAPDGSDPALVEAWRTALAGMKRHLEGERALAYQTAGRALKAWKSKKSFRTCNRMFDAFDSILTSQINKANDRGEAFEIATGHGATEGAYIP